MKQIFTLIFTILFSITILAQEQYSKARVMLDGAELSELSKLRIETAEGTFKKGVFFETDFSKSEIDRIKEAGFEVEIIIPDVKTFYRDRLAEEKHLLNLWGTDDDWEMPDNWEYGSMGGYYTLDEVMAELDSMHTLYPDLISARQPISTDTLTHDGRVQYWTRLSDNPDTDEDEPEILYTAIHHAREVITPQQTVWYMWHLLENYDSDPQIKYLVDNTEMYFVPFINPDGYQYNVDSDPEGGGMWRKNRRDNGDGSYGVDPNRNYGYMWGLDDNGSSPIPSDATYRGPAPFSEPENKNIRDFCNAHEFLIAMNYHSYGNYLLAVWGFTDEQSPDHELIMDFGSLMTNENSYNYGPGYTTIYPTNGGSDDWMYGEQLTKDKIIAYTPEIGGSSDGFWPQVSRIIPLCKEQMWQNLTAARLVGKYAVVSDFSPLVTDQMDNYAAFSIKRYGLMETDVFTVSITALDENIVEVGDPLEFENMEHLATEVDSISLLLDAGIEEGDEFSYLISVNNGDISFSDTVTRIYGTEVMVFEDDGETMENWNSNYWDITDKDYHSPENSITDSPDGDYNNSQVNIIEMDTVIDLTNVKMAFLRFWAKWEIEEGWDYAQVMIKPETGGSWTSLEGKYTRIGNSNQDVGKPLYDGFSEWVLEEINLKDHLWQKVKFRFRLYSDNYVTEDGFYFDDFVVTVISDITGIEEGMSSRSELFISNAYPNPAAESVSIQYDLKRNNGAALQLFDAFGNQLQKQELNGDKGVAKIQLNSLRSGVYYYRIVNGSQVSKTMKFVKL